MTVQCPSLILQLDPLAETAPKRAVVRMIPSGHPASESSAENCADCARARGCRACFEELVRRFQVPLLHFLVRRTGSRHDAEDLVQETFLLAHRNLTGYRSNWRFSTWLFTIANRVAISKWRQNRTSPAQSGEALDRAVDRQSPLTAAEQNERRSGLWDTAQKILEPDAFAGLWLSYVESMSADEIGQVLGRSANAVRILLHRARVRLAQSAALDSWESSLESRHES